jgi:Ca2+-binding EF-hand superfamily protein
MNEDTEGLFSIRQAKPIIKKIKREIDTDSETFIAEILKYEHIIEESTGRSGISKKNLYRVLHSFKAYLSEEEKRIMNTAFELREDKNLLDMQKLMKVIESIPIESQEKGIQYSLDWERKIYKRIGDYLQKKGKTLADTFNDLSENGYISQQMLASRLKEFQVNLNDNEINVLLSLLADKGEKSIAIKSFIQKFYAAYIINVISLYYYRSILLLLLIYPKMMK